MVACAGTASNISVEMIGTNAVGSGFVDGVPAVNIHHVSGGVRSSVLTEEIMVATGAGEQEKVVAAVDWRPQFLGPCGRPVRTCPME